VTPERFRKSIAGIAFLALLLTIAGIMNASASEKQSGKRVPAEWEPQEAIWLQWPGRYERVFQPAFAQMAAIISRYEKLNILFASKNDQPAL